MVHANAGQPAQSLFAVEDELQGKEISDAYTTGTLIQANVFRKGDEVHALIADGEDIDIGDFLESAGDGTLQEWSEDSAGAVEYPSSIVAQAIESCDMSGSSGEDPSTARCIVEIM